MAAGATFSCHHPKLCIGYGRLRKSDTSGSVVRQSSFPLGLASSLQEEARKTAESEGVSLNQLINLAVAEKLSALRTEEFFRSPCKYRESTNDFETDGPTTTSKRRRNSLKEMVGAKGFEPSTSWSRTTNVRGTK
jgi:hypothetical protein